MKKHAFFTGVLLTALLQAVSFEPLFSQSFLTTRLDGAGAGHAFLDISETTRENSPLFRWDEKFRFVFRLRFRDQRLPRGGTPRPFELDSK